MFILCELLMLLLTLGGPVHTGEIIGGEVAAPHSRPYMVLLELQGGKDTHCGGFLLNEDFVMTAAHCQAKSYVVILGLHNYRNKSEIHRVSVERAYPHKDFNSTQIKYDIMLLKLSSKAIFSKNVKRIALAGRDDGALPKSCSVSGWGGNDTNSGFMSVVLREVNVTLVNREKCAADNCYCSKGETGPYKGDSGGPLVCEDGTAYGVVSLRLYIKTDPPQIYNYFTRIADYRSWIDSIIDGKLK